MTDKDWIYASFCFASWVKPHFVSVDIQSLGRVEAILDVWERHFAALYPNFQTGNYDAALFYTQITAVSRIWTLSGYEILRVIYEQIRHNKVASEFESEFKHLFWRFTMVRMGIAKYEHARIKNSTGNPTDIRQIDSDGIVRVGWKVYCKKTESVLDITRRNLADEFVTTFSYIRKTYQQ